VKFADDVGDAAANKAPYHPRSMDGLLKKKYGSDAVSSSTLPATSMPNVKLAGQELCLLTPDGTGFKVVFDTKGFPILDSYAVFDTKIAADIVSKGNRSFDFKAATASLKVSISNGSVNSNVFNAEQLAAIMKNSARVPGYTWHHHQDLGRLRLVPSKIHNHPLMRHVGGFSLSQ